MLGESDNVLPPGTDGVGTVSIEECLFGGEYTVHVLSANGTVVDTSIRHTVVIEVYDLSQESEVRGGMMPFSLSLYTDTHTHAPTHPCTMHALFLISSNPGTVGVSLSLGAWRSVADLRGGYGCVPDPD